jgi:hypothetical protein
MESNQTTPPSQIAFGREIVIEIVFLIFSSNIICKANSVPNPIWDGVEKAKKKDSTFLQMESIQT